MNSILFSNAYSLFIAILCCEIPLFLLFKSLFQANNFTQFKFIFVNFLSILNTIRKIARIKSRTIVSCANIVNSHLLKMTFIESKLRIGTSLVQSSCIHNRHRVKFAPQKQHLTLIYAKHLQSSQKWIKITLWSNRSVSKITFSKDKKSTTPKPHIYFVKIGLLKQNWSSTQMFSIYIRNIGNIVENSSLLVRVYVLNKRFTIQFFDSNIVLNSIGQECSKKIYHSRALCIRRLFSQIEESNIPGRSQGGIAIRRHFNGRLVPAIYITFSRKIKLSASIRRTTPSQIKSERSENNQTNIAPSRRQRLLSSFRTRKVNQIKERINRKYNKRSQYCNSDKFHPINLHRLTKDSNQKLPVYAA